jgi:2OG-Fe(II) oxygenase superfamily
MRRVLNPTVLEQADPTVFRTTRPFPWWNPEGLVAGAVFDGLVRTAPPLESFNPSFGVDRAYGQQSHDRFQLMYRPGVSLSPEWLAFLRVLNGRQYRALLARMLGTTRFTLEFQWHYTPRGCSVSPHCDAQNRLASHLFYLTTAENWKDEWGGETLLLDDKGKFDPNSAPSISDFPGFFSAKCMPNRSLLFMRTEHSWHAVRDLRQPEGVLRKLFMVIISRRAPLMTRLRSRLVTLTAPLGHALTTRARR